MKNLMRSLLFLNYWIGWTCVVPQSLIDAMGTQKSIADKIHHGVGDYVLSLKGNHGQLHEDIKLFFEGANKKELIRSELVDGEYGRVEIRRCFVTEEIDRLANREKWPGLKSIVLIESE